MTWRKQKPYQGIIHDGCAHAQSVKRVANMNMILAVGFGCVQVWRGKSLIFDGTSSESDRPRLFKFEEMAAQDPNHDWRVVLHGPLRDAKYQRHEKERWVLVGPNEGFA